MTSIVIRSKEANAAATALLLAARDHAVCLLSPTLSAGDRDFSYFGEIRSVSLLRVEDLDLDEPLIGIVFAEGEDVRAGLNSVLDIKEPDLLVIIGGGITGAIEALEGAKEANFDFANILHVAGFVVGGNSSGVKSEKQGVMAGFLAEGASKHVRALADRALPQVAIGEGFGVALSSVNALVHLPPMIFNAMSVERGDDLRFYVEGFGDSVSRLVAALDADRLKLGSALGFSLTPVAELMERTRGAKGMPGDTFREKVNTVPSLQSTKLPSSLRHRFLAHELQSTFAPMAELAKAVRVDVPTIDSVVRIGEILLDTDLATAAKPAARKFLQLTKG